jgi:hypothetical protein
MIVKLPVRKTTCKRARLLRDGIALAREIEDDRVFSTKMQLG